MTITVNGRPRPLTAGSTLAELLADEFGSTRGSAVAVDGEVVPRAGWTRLRLRDGQAIELVTAVQGG
jgi:sulfur carrier protein